MEERKYAIEFKAIEDIPPPPPTTATTLKASKDIFLYKDT